MADDRIDVTFGAEFSELVSAVDQIKASLASLTAPVRAVNDDFAAASQQMIAGARSASSSWDAVRSIADDGIAVFARVALGAETWRQALTKIFADLATSFAESIADMMLQWLAFQAMTASTGGMGGGGGLFGLVGGLFGGGEAAGAIGDLGALAMFQEGAWSIPRDMVALVHAGEMILPANVAASARAGGSAAAFPIGGAAAPAMPAINLNVSGIDNRSIVQGIVNNPPVLRSLARAIQRYTPQNPSLETA